MDPLEGTTLDLIHRRRVNTFYPGYAIILIVLGIIVALPLVKVDVVSTSGGMIRPSLEAVELFTSITGIVDSSMLADHFEVKAGDTLVWMRKDLPETRISELRDRLGRNLDHMQDIDAILFGQSPGTSTRYIQSFRMHTASTLSMQLRIDYLEDEYNAAQLLYKQQVIPLMEFEKARSEYLLACARLEDHRESYKSRLEDDLNRFTIENRHIEGELAEIRTSLQNYKIMAPASGMLSQCKTLKPGSVIQPGMKLGSISPHGELVADCYVETTDIREIQKGMMVRIRLNGKSPRACDRLESTVSQIDPDVMLLNGRAVYRVRCLIDNQNKLVPGMTFSASMLLYRTSVASLLTAKLNKHFNPGLAREETRDF